jgi:hypothetical protein
VSRQAGGSEPAFHRAKGEVVLYEQLEAALVAPRRCIAGNRRAD